MRQHQRQRISGKKIFIICAVSICCMIICLTLFFNVFHVDRLKATNNQTDMPVFITPEQPLVNEKNIPEPVFARRMNSTTHALQAKQVKPLPR